MSNELTEKKDIKERILNSTFVTNYKKVIGSRSSSSKDRVKKVTARLAYSGVLTALATIFNIITFYPVKYMALSFTVIPTAIAAILLGPLSGFLVGFLGDLLGWLILPQGAYMPLIGIASGAWGLIIGVVFLAFKLKAPIKIIIGFVISLLICTCFLNTFNLWLVYSNGKSTFWAYLWARFPFQLAMATANCFLTILTHRELVKARIIRDLDPINNRF